MTPAFRYTLLWLLGSAIMVMAALTSLSAAYADGQYVPSNADAFYHARRILDAVMTGAPVIQFDPRIHVPEGSWLTWPWGYDTLLANIVKVFGPFSSEAQANRILMNIPAAASPVAVALVLVIARQLKLSGILSALMVLGFSGLPLVYMLFSVGNVDHHYAELIWTLMTLSSGIWFFGENQRSYGSAIALGCVLGSGLAIHNGLFILQIPVAALFGIRWLRAQPLPDSRRTLAFAGALILTALLMCLPSEPWRRGFFEFYTLSWFHLYISVCVGLFALLLAHFPRTALRIGLLFGAVLLALLPIASAMQVGKQFVTGDLESIQGIVEVLSPYKLYHDHGSELSTRFFSWLLWLSAPAMVLNFWWFARWRNPSMQFVALFGALSLAILQSQYRFGVFGVASMLLTPLLLARLLAESRPAIRHWISAATVALFAICFIPTLTNWTIYWTLGGNPAYAPVRSLFPVMKDLCEKRPGIVLTDIDGGHWVRYHSDCSVIGDVFLLTPLHAAKARETVELMRMTPAELIAKNKTVRYVFAHHTVAMFNTGNPKSPETPILADYVPFMNALEMNLLQEKPDLPPEFVLRWQATTTAGQLYGRMYEIVRTP